MASIENRSRFRVGVSRKPELTRTFPFSKTKAAAAYAQALQAQGLIDERCQCVEPATVDRELDIISAICRVAINTWRIPVHKSPMDGVRRPRYFNERDRRLKAGEEEALVAAAREEDRRRSIDLRFEELLQPARVMAAAAATKYERKRVIADAQERYRPLAESTYLPGWCTRESIAP